MTKDEALKLALEALRLYQRTLAPTDTQCRGVAAVDAIKQALAAPVQEPVAIALNTGTKQGVKWIRNVEHGERLYTTPPAAPVQEPMFTYDQVKAHIQAAMMSAAQRQWVGLTDAEAQWIYDSARTPSGMIEMTEAKLREKNTWVGLTRWEIDAKLKENK
jgi:hypothetical protein